MVYVLEWIRVSQYEPRKQLPINELVEILQLVRFI